MAIKNFWSLNVDEALVANKLKNELKKDGYEVFFPLKAQLKDIDLLLVNLSTKKSFTIQVKGSRTYPPTKKEIKRFGDGQAGWFGIKKGKIFMPENPVDFFIFLVHLTIQGKTKKEIQLNYVIIPSIDFRKILLKENKKTDKDGGYHFTIWINPIKEKAWEFDDRKKDPIDLSKYLNAFDLLK